MEYETGSLERVEDIERNPAGVVKRWLLEIQLADKREDTWRKKGEEILTRYRQKKSKKHSFNILWANTETLRPAIYNSLPKPDVRRRYKDADPLGKAVSEALSRSLEYGLDATDFDGSIKACVLDMLLPGRGIARVRYVPSLQQVGTNEAEEQHEDGGEALEGTEELKWEQAPIEHVQWDDFRMGPGKEWAEIPWIAYRHRLTRKELEELAPECAADVQLDVSDDEEVKQSDESIQDTFKTAEVWEIWDKEEKEVLFIAKGYKSKPLKVIPDPLNLTDFWPSPKPLYAVEDSSSMVPTPLYELYKEQADELDTVSRRINIVVKGLKLRGVYDATITELSELMRGEDNDLIPSEGITALLDRGGVEKAVMWLPIDMAAQVLKELYVQREQCKAVIYEITGISDILRGSTNANETAAAQQIKNQWGNNRLKRLQADVSRFIRDLMRLQAEIIGEKFQPETILTMTGLQFPTQEQKMQAQAQMQQGQQQDPQIMQMLQTPSVEEVMQVLRDDKLRTFKVDVETDSTVAASIETDMSAMRDVLTAVVQLVQGFGPAVQMGAMPVEAVKELILAVTRRAKLGNAVEDALDKIKQPDPQPQDNGEQVKAQMEQMKSQMQDQQHQREMQMEQQRLRMEFQAREREQQTQAAIEQHRNEMEYQRQQQQQAHEAQMQQMADRAEQQTKLILAHLDRITKLEIAEISAQTTLNAAQMGAANAATDGREDGE